MPHVKAYFVRRSYQCLFAPNVQSRSGGAHSSATAASTDAACQCVFRATIMSIIVYALRSIATGRGALQSDRGIDRCRMSRVFSRNNHINACLRLTLNRGREGRTPVRPRRHLSPHVKGMFWGERRLYQCLFALRTNGRSGERPSLAAAIFYHFIYNAFVIMFY